MFGPPQTPLEEGTIPDPPAPTAASAIMATTAPRQRTPSMSAPLGEGLSRPKHKRTITGYSAKEIKSVEAAIPESQRAA